MSNTPQGEAIDGNAADDALMVDQGQGFWFTFSTKNVLMKGWSYLGRRGLIIKKY
ncbi:hypothetical protein ACFL9T_22095 [Thermodesulfobacteriota bacterium]